jgi:2-methylcitrate dehydratase
VTVAAGLARFVAARSWNDLSGAARKDLKIRVLDAFGCALGALEAPPVQAIRAQLDDFGGRPLCTLIGGGRTAPDRAALYNGALVRYLDFNDSYFAPARPAIRATTSRPCSRRLSTRTPPGGNS